MGRHRWTRGLSRQRGFTLIEIMVVVVIVSVLFVVTLPSLRSVNDNNRLRSSVREMTSLMRYARSEAVFTGRTTQVFLDTQAHQFWLDLRRPTERRAGGRDDRKSSMERKRDLEQKVEFEAVNALEKNILKNDVIAVDFYPDGTASPALITVKNNNNIRYTVEVFKSTGQVEISKRDLDSVMDAGTAESYPLPDNYYEGIADSGAYR